MSRETQRASVEGETRPGWRGEVWRADGPTRCRDGNVRVRDRCEKATTHRTTMRSRAWVHLGLQLRCGPKRQERPREASPRTPARTSPRLRRATRRIVISAPNEICPSEQAALPRCEPFV